MKPIRSLLLLGALALAGAVHAADALDQKIGWLHGQCLAIRADGLPSGSTIRLVLLDEPQTMGSGTVEAAAADGSQCFALMDDRRKVNQAVGYHFYTVATTSPVELAIGMVTDKQAPELDLNKAHFSYCSTGEGVQFSVWPAEAHQGKPLWQGYYYTGYDTEADCPEQ